MFSKTRKFIVSLVSSLTLSSLVLFPQAVKAQVKVSPMVIMAETEQGQATGVITLTNQSNQEARIRLSAQPFTYSEGGFESLEESENDLSPYLIYSPREVVLQPGQVRRVRLLARLLPSNQEQEYRAVIFAEPLREVNSDSGLTVNSRVGVTIYVRHGDLSFNLEPQNASYNEENNFIALRVINSGNATVRPGVRWTLNQNGEEITTGGMSQITIVEQGDRIIPIRFQPDQEITPGEYQVTGDFLLGDPRFPQTIPFDFNVYIPE